MDLELKKTAENQKLKNNQVTENSQNSTKSGIVPLMEDFQEHKHDSTGFDKLMRERENQNKQNKQNNQNKINHK